MVWKPPERNFDRIQFEGLRKIVDIRFNAVHDELSRCYKDEKEFIHNGRNFGVLTKEQFDRLHGLIFHLRDVAFHAANLAQPLAQRIDDAKYRFIDNGDGTTTDRLQEALNRIKEARDAGTELVI
jgi:hypothetical protein